MMPRHFPDLQSLHEKIVAPSTKKQSRNPQTKRRTKADMQRQIDELLADKVEALRAVAIQVVPGATCAPTDKDLASLRPTSTAPPTEIESLGATNRNMPDSKRQAILRAQLSTPDISLVLDNRHNGTRYSKVAYCEMCRVNRYTLHSYMYSLDGYHDFCAVVAKTAKNRSWIDVARLMCDAKVIDWNEKTWEIRCHRWLDEFGSSNHLLNPMERFLNDDERLERSWCRAATCMVDAVPCYMNGRNTSRYDGYKKRSLCSSTVICDMMGVPIAMISGQEPGEESHDGAKLEQLGFVSGGFFHYHWEIMLADGHYTRNSHCMCPCPKKAFVGAQAAEMLAHNPALETFGVEKTHFTGLSMEQHNYNDWVKKYRSRVENWFAQIRALWDFVRDNNNTINFNCKALIFAHSWEKFCRVGMRGPVQPPPGPYPYDSQCSCTFHRIERHGEADKQRIAAALRAVELGLALPGASIDSRAAAEVVSRRAEGEAARKALKQQAKKRK